MMTNELVHALQTRADRAERHPDVETLLAEIDERVGRRARRRRSALAGAAGSVTVAAVAIAVTVAGSGGARHDGSRPAVPAGGPGSTTPTSAAVQSPSPSPSVSAARPTPPAPIAPGHLVAVAAAPRSAPASLRLVPRGYQFLGETHSGDVTTYGDPQTTNRNPLDFTGKLVILPGRIPPVPAERIDATIIGKPASITWEPGGGFGWIVHIRCSKKIDVMVEIPVTADVNRAQVKRMLDTLDVRDVSNPSVG